MNLLGRLHILRDYCATVASSREQPGVREHASCVTERGRRLLAFCFMCDSHICLPNPGSSCSIGSLSSSPCWWRSQGRGLAVSAACCASPSRQTPVSKRLLLRPCPRLRAPPAAVRCRPSGVRASRDCGVMPVSGQSFKHCRPTPLCATVAHARLAERGNCYRP